MLPLLAMLLLASTPEAAPEAAPWTPPEAECRTSQGKTACGYACTVTNLDLGCARTPYGICQTFGGRVYCWDPPMVAIQHPPEPAVAPDCTVSRDKVACGYRCKLEQGEVACARTPYGICRMHMGVLTCWDPPDSVIHEYGKKTPKPACLTASTTLSCGYDCKATRTEVQCATTPKGRCTLNDQQITCFDPPSLLHCDHSEPPPPPPQAQARRH